MANRNKNKSKQRLMQQEAKDNNFQDAAEIQADIKGRKRLKSKSHGRRSANGAPKFSANSMINNVSWYTPNATLLKNVANIPFGRITGMPFISTSLGDAGNPNSNEFVAVPGVMSLQIIPTFGPSGSTLSVNALNLSAQSLFSYVRHANSGAANYESNDLMLYVLSVSNLIAYYAYLVRLYGVTSNYAVMNKYTPQALVTSMGVNFQDVQTNYPNLRAFINLLAYRLQTLVIPKGISLVDRQAFLYENVYTDADNAKAQYYLLNPVGFYRYYEGSSTTNGGYLQFSPLMKSNPTVTAANLLTVQELIAYGNDLLDPIVGSTDFNEIIAGDILKAFGSNVYSVPSIGEDYQVTPQYNKEILSQIENAVVYDGSIHVMLSEEYADFMPTVKQATQINSSTLEPQIVLPLYPLIKSSVAKTQINWTTAQQKQTYYNDYMLNMHEDSVTPEMVMVSSRLVSGNVQFASTITIEDEGTATLSTIGNCGSEIVFNGSIFYYNQSDPATPPQLAIYSISRAEMLVNAYGGTFSAPTVTSPEIGAIQARELE